MRRQDFEEIVRDAVEGLPSYFLDIMRNVDVQVRRWPNKREMKQAELDPEETLLGLYVGVPITERDDGYNMVTPDVITVFQATIEEICSSKAEVKQQVRQTIVHEVAHYFGISDAELVDWGVA
jgi:predicted Zn-dependent protease with MMP-like domain